MPDGFCVGLQEAMNIIEETQAPFVDAIEMMNRWGLDDDSTYFETLVQVLEQAKEGMQKAMEQHLQMKKEVN
jgi:hypothetical protein